MLARHFDGKKGYYGNQYDKSSNKGTLTTPKSKKEALSDAGFSTHQQRTISRIGAIPEEQFERLVESDNPPTLSKLAEKGKVSRQELPGEPENY